MQSSKDVCQQLIGNTRIRIWQQYVNNGFMFHVWPFGRNFSVFYQRLSKYCYLHVLLHESYKILTQEQEFWKRKCWPAGKTSLPSQLTARNLSMRDICSIPIGIYDYTIKIPLLVDVRIHISNDCRRFCCCTCLWNNALHIFRAEPRVQFREKLHCV